MFFSVDDRRNLIWLNFGTILKMALFSSSRNGQTDGEAHKGASLFSVPLLPFVSILILTWPSW